VDSEGSECEVKPFPSRKISIAATSLSLVASVMALMSAFWQHLSSASAITMVEALTYGAVTWHVGAGAMAIGWVATALCLTVVIGLLTMILSISILSAFEA